MKKFTLIWIGKTQSKPIKALIEDYKTRVSYSAKIEISEIKDGLTLEQEAKEIEKRLPQNGYVFLLDETGKEFTSREFSQKIETLATQGHSHFAFVIGSAYGFAEQSRKLANATLALSKFTFTHEMVRVFLLEQLYRAEMIAKGSGYHH